MTVPTRGHRRHPHRTFWLLDPTTGEWHLLLDRQYQSALAVCIQP
jgi:hypothetical protein